MIVSDDWGAVQTYSTDGNLKSTIKIPDGHKALEVAFYHGVGKIIVLTYVEKEDSYFLLSNFETSELEKSRLFCESDQQLSILNIEMKSHLRGPVAVRCNKAYIFTPRY
jgi:hypothetical protein